MTTAIKVENLGKKYLIGHENATAYRTLRDSLSNSVRSFARRFRHPVQANPGTTDLEEFWALQEINFEIKPGERIGIIGRNGAGKSTLLKILSRITAPTTGKAVIHGRVASLLEVGTGFHPELTGRENIFLNGAILGMRKAEIKSKFDEIVAFAEVEKFLDTPVKRYSSGMYVRLAFAVAAHLEPEILIVDEVLAVGDAQFQKKCLGKMEAVSKEGKTLLFVSHNMAAVTKLCGRGIYLSEGRLHTAGDTADVVRIYLQDSARKADVKLSERKDRQGSGIARFSSMDVLDSAHCKTQSVICGQDMTVRIKLSSQTKGLILKNPTIAIGIDDSRGLRVWHLSNESIGQHFSGIDVDNSCLDFQIPRLPLVAGAYTMVLFLSSNGDIVDWIQDAGGFNVELGDYYGTGRLPPPGQGVFLSDYHIRVAG
ncbi:MAG: ABC transporter ATP-binding protein [Methylosarcina sp.]